MSNANGRAKQAAKATGGGASPGSSRRIIGRAWMTFTRTHTLPITISSDETAIQPAQGQP